MITLIGTYNSVIGFGLCGIKKIHEVNPRTSVHKIQQYVEQTDSSIILIDEEVYERVKESVSGSGKIFVQIPDRYKENVLMEDIDKLVKDTIGISVKVT